MTKITKVLTLALVALVLAGCSSTVAPPTPKLSEPHGRWLGDAYINAQYAGAISAHYDTKTWAWCLPNLQCIVGHTSGWDLVDAAGERAQGTYTGSSVKIRYTYQGDVLTATLYPNNNNSYVVSPASVSSMGLQEALEALR